MLTNFFFEVPVQAQPQPALFLGNEQATNINGLLGDPVSFTVVFDNTAPTATPGGVGFGPFVDLLLPASVDVTVFGVQADASPLPSLTARQLYTFTFDGECVRHALLFQDAAASVDVRTEIQSRVLLFYFLFIIFLLYWEA